MADNRNGISDQAKQKLAAAMGGSASKASADASSHDGKRAESQQTTEQRVIALIEDATGVEREEITPKSSLVNDLNVDSLTLVDIAVRLEEEFNIAVEDEAMNKAGTVSQLVKLVDKRLKEKSQG